MDVDGHVVQMCVINVTLAQRVGQPLEIGVALRKPNTRQVTATGTPSAASSRTSGNFILGVPPRARSSSGSAQDFDLLLEELVSLAQLSQLISIRRRDAFLDAVVDLDLADPSVQTGLGDHGSPGRAGVSAPLASSPWPPRRLGTLLEMPSAWFPFRFLRGCTRKVRSQPMRVQTPEYDACEKYRPGGSTRNTSPRSIHE